jgi:hypothetical protein
MARRAQQLGKQLPRGVDPLSAAAKSALRRTRRRRRAAHSKCPILDGDEHPGAQAVYCINSGLSSGPAMSMQRQESPRRQARLAARRRSSAEQHAYRSRGASARRWPTLTSRQLQPKNTYTCTCTIYGKKVNKRATVPCKVVRAMYTYVRLVEGPTLTSRSIHAMGSRRPKTCLGTTPANNSKSWQRARVHAHIGS